jgi:hypothetical protein
MRSTICTDMENHTKRIRKARRQGLAQNGKDLGPSPRVRFNTRLAGGDIPTEPRANERRTELITGRKAKRQKPGRLRGNLAVTRARP